MLLSARVLNAVSGVNAFEYATQLSWTEGDTVDVYFQLIDASLDRAEQGFVPTGRRYMPASGGTLSVVFDSVNDAKKVTRAATNPFASDTSIWKVVVQSTDLIRGTVALKLTLTEGIKVTRGSVKAACLVMPQNAVG